MPELRFDANAAQIERIGTFINEQRGTNVGRAALQFMDWAVQEMSQGRQIQAVGESGDVHVPVLLYCPQTQE